MAKKKLKEQPVLEVVKDEIKLEKPTPEQVAQYKLDFENAMNDFTETRFSISENGAFAANDLGIFLIDFLKRYGMWTKTGWMGMVKMEEELRKAMQLDNTDTGLTLDYQALEFCGYVLTNPGGIGYETALEFEKIADKYSNIMITVGEQIEIARAKLQAVQYLQEKWAAGEQGFFLADLEPKKEETEETEETGVTIDATKKD